MNTANVLAMPLIVISTTLSYTEGERSLSNINYQPLPYSRVGYSATNSYDSNTGIIDNSVSDDELFCALCKVATELSSDIKPLDSEILDEINKNFWDLLA